MAGKSRVRRLIGYVAALIAVGVLVGGGFFMIRSARRAAWRARRINSFRQIALALHNHHDASKRFPPAVRTDELGRPLSSWRFLLLPFIEAMMLDWDYNARWNDPANRWLASSPFHAYCFSERGDSAERLHTNVVAITGPGTAFEDDRASRIGELTSDLIMVIEIADSGIHWAEPGDLHIDEVPESITSGIDGDGVCVLFVDGTVFCVSHDVPFNDLKKFFTVESAKKYDREEVLGPYRIK